MWESVVNELIRTYVVHPFICWCWYSASFLDFCLSKTYSEWKVGNTTWKSNILMILEKRVSYTLLFHRRWCDKL